MLTFIIIIITCFVSFAAFNKHELFVKYQLNPYMVKNNNEWVRIISHAFLHADYIHLFFNMFVLYMFGGFVENAFIHIFGSKGIFYFFILYVGGVLFSAIPTFRKHNKNYNYNAVGASGAVSAVVFSFIILSPLRELCFWGIQFLCFPGVIWGIAYLVYSYYKSKQMDDNINHEAHFWGALFGVVFTIILNYQLAISFWEQILFWISK